METYLELGVELDKEAWDWLYITHPEIADKLALVVKRGATPEGISAFIVRHSGINRVDLARRCEAAARHLGSLRS